NYARSLKMMRTMKKCKAFMALVQSVNLQFPPRFEMRNGSEICFRSADNEDDLRGEKLKLICVDEAAILSENLFWNVLSPMTADADGTIVAASTYAGRNWFYQLAEDGKKANPHQKTWVYPTATGIAFQGPKGLARLARIKATTPPMTWQQEYDCEPLAILDAVFKFVDQCIGPYTP